LRGDSERKTAPLDRLSSIGGYRVSRLIQPEYASAGEPDACKQTPTTVTHPALHADAAMGEVGDRCLDVVAHQVDLVLGRTVCGVHGDLRRRQGDDEPPVTSVDGSVPAKDLAQHLPVCLGIGAVDDRVGRSDHRILQNEPDAGQWR
jgi:hypothetical protein